MDLAARSRTCFFIQIGSLLEEKLTGLNILTGGMGYGVKVTPPLIRGESGGPQSPALVRSL